MADIAINELVVVDMIKVITYGTYDHLHYGHIRLLERAKELGDYLIVGVTSDNFDIGRGKINVQQSLIERIQAVRDTGIADEIIVEEYEGQKIDDIKSYGVDIFTVGSDWVGTFDYLSEYCKVVYLDRTQGVSSTMIRSSDNKVRLGLFGDANTIEFGKYFVESKQVNGIEVTGICLENNQPNQSKKLSIPRFYNHKEGHFFYEKDKVITDNECEYFDNLQGLLEKCDAVYIAGHPTLRYGYVKEALSAGKHVLCKSPTALSPEENRELSSLAKDEGLILMDAIKTAYSTAYNRLVLVAKSGRIGKIISVESTCTSLSDEQDIYDSKSFWNTIDMGANGDVASTSITGDKLY